MLILKKHTQRKMRKTEKVKREENMQKEKNKSRGGGGGGGGGGGLFDLVAFRP